MKKVTSENVQEYLARYMEGESTQEEQRLLKEYFGNTKDLPAGLRPYAQMFVVLEEKAETPSVEALDRFSEGQIPAVRRSVKLWPLVAAACVAALITNQAQAMQMGQEALQEIFSNGNEEEQLTDLFNAK